MFQIITVLHKDIFGNHFDEAERKIGIPFCREREVKEICGQFL